MAAPAKRPLKRPAIRPVGEPVDSVPTPRPFLRFYHSDALRAETLEVLAAIEQARDPLQHREALADLAAKLLDSGLDYYFLRALKLARVGVIVEQSARIAMAGASRVLASVIRNVLVRMSGTQLIAVCGHLRQLME
jgi:hypothetical protein